MPAKNILCAIHFSEYSNAAMVIAAQMAAESGAALMLAHVWQPPILTRDSAALLADDLYAEFVADCTKALANAKAQVEGLGASKVETKLLAGVAWDCLVKEAASDPSYDLIVVGTHGHRACPRRLGRGECRASPAVPGARRATPHRGTRSSRIRDVVSE